MNLDFAAMYVNLNEEHKHPLNATKSTPSNIQAL